jgi:DNA-binding transcriptional regulator YiaG
MSELTLEGHLHRRCGGHYALAVEEVTIRLSGMTAKVDRAMYKCDKCGDRQHTVEQREEAEREAVLTMRSQHTLLTAREIKHFRESIALTTAQFGELLHGLPKGIVEGWEKGRYLQSPAVDAMIRSLSDREERARRAARAGFVLPPLPGEVVSGAGNNTGDSAPISDDNSGDSAPISDDNSGDSAPIPDNSGDSAPIPDNSGDSAPIPDNSGDSAPIPGDAAPAADLSVAGGGDGMVELAAEPEAEPAGVQQ